MKAMVAYKGKYILAEQDKRGMGTEADLVLYKGATEIYRSSHPKYRNVDELRVRTVKTLEGMKNV